MSNFFHHKPNVPQAPYHLAPQPQRRPLELPQRVASRQDEDRTASSYAPQRRNHQRTSTEAVVAAPYAQPRRTRSQSPQLAAPAMVREDAYVTPHQASYRSARGMPPAERSAAQVPAPPSPAAESDGHESLSRYLTELQAEDAVTQEGQALGSPIHLPQQPMEQLPSPVAEPASLAPAGQEPAAQEDTYAATAQNVDASFRVPPTATYDVAAALTSQPALGVSQTPVLATQLAGGDVQIEVFGPTQTVLARVLLRGVVPQRAQ